MSCNGCRVLRKGCGESCILRPCLQWIERPEAQGNATVFVAKFFGRASLMSFISSVPAPQRPALFKSLLFEACGRTINPVSGAVGLLWTDNWHLCQTAVDTVLRGGSLRQKGEISRATDAAGMFADSDEMLVYTEGDGEILSFSANKRRKRALSLDRMPPPPCDRSSVPSAMRKPRPGTPSMISDDSVDIIDDDRHQGQPRLMNLFV